MCTCKATTQSGACSMLVRVGDAHSARVCKQVDTLLSSPQQRAVATAEEIAAAQAAAGRTAPAVEVQAALRNRDWGALEGTPASQVRLLSRTL